MTEVAFGITKGGASQLLSQGQTDDSTEMTNEDNRFVAELEFVQCLANPRYLGHLASAKQRHETFDSKEFVDYLKYLLYWKRPEYARFVTCPHALYFLEQLQDRRFRDELQKPHFIRLLEHQQLQFYWLGSEHK